MGAVMLVDARRLEGFRSTSLDAFRGLAIVAMMVDHLAVVTQSAPELRLMVGRLAMPMFFVLAGTLSTRLRWRHLHVAALGVLLPVAVPWIDNPNVLVIWAAGAVVLAAFRWANVNPAVVVVLALAIAANGYSIDPGRGYPPHLLIGLMALGAILPRTYYAWAARVPGARWFGMLGRYPVSWYVGHLLLIQAAGLIAFGGLIGGR